MPEMSFKGCTKQVNYANYLKQNKILVKATVYNLPAFKQKEDVLVMIDFCFRYKRLRPSPNEYARANDALLGPGKEFYIEDVGVEEYNYLHPVLIKIRYKDTNKCYWTTMEFLLVATDEFQDFFQEKG